MLLRRIFLLSLPIALITSCSNDDSEDVDSIITIDNPTTYVFERNGESSVSFGGQTTRILMAEEIIGKLKDDTATADALKAMFAHEEGASDFADADLNASDKNLRGKTAASFDFFSTNATDQALVRADFENWIQTQVDEVFPNWNTAAAAGTAGQIADGSSTRYVTGKGLEMNQVFSKSLIGALMVDQILNNYISSDFIDGGTQRTDNDEGVLAEGKNYTAMEHDWDEAYGYAFGTAQDLADPRSTIGEDDSFLNKYIGRVEGDSDFVGINDDIYQAFKLGRAAIVAKDYTVRDEQAEILRELISRIIGIRAVYYMQQGKNAINQTTPDYGGAFHDLSEGYGFVYSLQFTRKPNSTDPYFTKAEVDAFLADLMDDGDNGLWDVTPETLDAISTGIAERFSFTVEQAAN
ncbi:DUF4856 domain-containing protein [Flagellimonas halotolerans]|uniref:DUF4856 domain-containing protein n=1 Tax=Flagellimonas halotolerans TaxID=3112164 RepID=A0ABU6IPN4_9FLAO|nr:MULTISPECIES: DUF4856 domain-containing protein [unclassified Allomuricauda]MEC3965077.1 DUF4856 domain-containing protein [Muricauda sp. SYSU M86414]MEC4265078.1 DUF4856 domain-containing protein [Muricauda sp. SYSU M84420]